MIEFLFASANLPFTIALGVMIMLGTLEIVSFLLGVGISNLFDSMLPELDADVDIDTDIDIDTEVDIDVDGDVDVDVDADVDADIAADGDLAEASVRVGALPGILRALSWLGLGKVPVIILVSMFLMVFGLIGLVSQYVVLRLTGQQFMLPGFIAWLPALMVTLPIMRVFSNTMARIMPKEETSAVSEKTFVGRIALITGGVARRDHPAQAKLVDEYGQTHYIMVEPDDDDETFEDGSDVILVKRVSAVFRAIRNTSEALID